MPRNTTRRNSDRDAARRAQVQQTEEQPQDAAETEQATPEVTEGTPEVTAPEQPEQPEQDAPEQDAATVNTDSDDTATEQPAEDTPEPEVTEDAEPQGDAPEDTPEQPEQPEQPQAPQDAEPETPRGYTPPPDPEAEPTVRLEPEAPPSFATLLAVAGNVALGPEVRWHALVRAGVQLVSRIARTPEGQGTVTYASYRIPGPNGSGPARMNALTQLLYVLGGDMVGRIITHDNTKTRPGHMRITTYAEFAEDVIDLLELAWPVLDIWGNAARKASAQWRRDRHMTNGTYRDNLQERDALISKGRELAQDIARATADENLSEEEQALYRFHTARIILNTAAPLKGERHYAATWNLPGNLGGMPVPAMFTPRTPAPVTEQQQQAPALAGATA